MDERNHFESGAVAGWTREEAISTPKGELPPRVAAARAEGSCV